ncbi:MAG: LytTR family DNA-binding domain-containing protein [Suilimivivens sp.]|nr:LytTR family transcriptional regulator DNA-binding domain-containing protein [Lachnospiraceae bacterium]MDY5869254.1 LytTR family DNA-binding domain-containing protein [Lachnospiraceae bacterium]
MKIRLEENPNIKEPEILIRYGRMTEEVRRLERMIRSVEKEVRCQKGNQVIWVNASDIFYIESVDKKTFVYGQAEIYRSDQRLYQLEEELKEEGFVRVSKYCLMNINMLEGICSLRNSRMEATLKNGERINVTRKYLAQIRKHLEER